MARFFGVDVVAWRVVAAGAIFLEWLMVLTDHDDDLLISDTRVCISRNSETLSRC